MTWGKLGNTEFGAAQPQEALRERHNLFCYNSRMTKRQIVDDVPYAHFVTFTGYRRRKSLDLDHPKRIILGVLNDQLRLQNTKCVGFVLMPKHVNAIVWFPQPGKLSKFMQGWKRKSSYQIRKWYRENESSYFVQMQGDPFFAAQILLV